MEEAASSREGRGHFPHSLPECSPTQQESSIAPPCTWISSSRPKAMLVFHLSGGDRKRVWVTLQRFWVFIKCFLSLGQGLSPNTMLTSEVRCGPCLHRADITGNEQMSYRDTVTIQLEAWCPCLLRGFQGGTWSIGPSRLGRTWQSRWAGFISQCCASVGCLPPPFSPSLNIPVQREIRCAGLDQLPPTLPRVW